MIAEGTALITVALERGTLGEYQVQAAIAALHDQADHYTNTDWAQILSLYDLLESMTGNPTAAAQPGGGGGRIWPRGRTRARRR